jgi:hypothetical protein
MSGQSEMNHLFPYSGLYWLGHEKYKYLFLHSSGQWEMNYLFPYRGLYWLGPEKYKYPNPHSPARRRITVRQIRLLISAIKRRIYDRGWENICKMFPEGNDLYYPFFTIDKLSQRVTVDYTLEDDKRNTSDYRFDVILCSTGEIKFIGDRRGFMHEALEVLRLIKNSLDL